MLLKHYAIFEYAQMGRKKEKPFFPQLNDLYLIGVIL